jgi:hypothetical protein
VRARRFVDIHIIILLPMRRHATPARIAIQPIIPIDEARSAVSSVERDFSSWRGIITPTDSQYQNLAGSRPLSSMNNDDIDRTSFAAVNPTDPANQVI